MSDPQEKIQDSGMLIVLSQLIKNNNKITIVAIPEIIHVPVYLCNTRSKNQSHCSFFASIIS